MPAANGGAEQRDTRPGKIGGNIAGIRAFAAAAVASIGGDQ
jgi:hypothetical protein